jgi:hypothetical protein
MSLASSSLIPPTLGELIPEDHPAHFIAEFLDYIDREVWIQLEVSPDGETFGDFFQLGGID